MKVLLDTHAFLWWITDNPELSGSARKIIGDSANELFLSAASGWEIAVKAKLGRIKLPDKPDIYLSNQMAINRIQGLPVLMSHALYTYNLPDHHRDPFDRLIIAQSLLEGLPVLTKDPFISKYRIKIIW